jgi:hypothetical protein
MFRTVLCYFRTHLYLEVVISEVGSCGIRLNLELPRVDRLKPVCRINTDGQTKVCLLFTYSDSAELGLRCGKFKGFRRLIYLTGAPSVMRAWLGLGEPPEIGL